MLLILLVAPPCHAYNIQSGARVGATWRASKTIRHVWARRSDGHLMRLELNSDTDDEAIWADQMWSGNPPNVHELGVDSISFTNSVGAEEEHVANVGADNRIYDWRLVNGVPQVSQYLSVGPPAGQTLTGRIAIGRRLNNIFFFVSTVNGRLYRYEVNDWSTGTYTIQPAITGVSTTAMISATGPETGTYVRVFYSKTDNTVWQYKYDGANWTSVSFNGPAAPAAPNPADRPARLCDLVGATEGQIGTAAGYRTYLFCTRAGGDPHKVTVYYKVASGLGSQIFGAWSSAQVPAGSVATSGFGLTTRRRAEGGPTTYTLEVFVLGLVTKNLYHLEHTANQNNIGVVTDLGWDGETTARPGGIVAAGDPARGFSDTYFVGQAHDSSWLYRKIGDANGNPFPELWVNYGASDGWKTYSAGAATPSPTESATAILGAKVVIAAIYSDPNAWATNKVLFSDDEGVSFTGPTTIPEPSVLPSWLEDPPGVEEPSWGVAFDPVVDFDDSGRAYILELRTADQYDGSDGGRGVVMWSTTTGALNFEMVVFGSLDKADHPWIAIHRNANGADEIHMAWQIEDQSRIVYTHAPVTNLAMLTANLVDLDTGAITTSASRVTVSQGDGSVYVGWTHGICRVDRVLDDGTCEGLLGYGEAYTPDTASTESGSELRFPHTDNTFRSVRAFSIVADPNGPYVYYAFQKREPGVAEGHGPFDLYVARLAYDALGGDIDPGPRILLNIFGDDDGMHQTFPELTISRDGPTTRMIFASWYDWANVSCTIGGVVYHGQSWADSACYQVYQARSTDFGLSWEGTPHEFPTVSDPGHLPRRNLFAPEEERFLGDYHSVTGDILHSAHIAITAPVGGADQVTNIERGWVSHGYWNATE